VKERRKHEKALILEEVHKCVTQIADLTKQHGIELLTELSPYAQQLTHCIERVFIYGLKTSWRGSKASFWEYILASVNILEDKDLLSEVSLISSINVLTNDGRGRAFLRQSLHVERTAAYISRITEDQDLAKSWYADELAILTAPKDRSKFLALLDSVSYKIPFNMLLADKKLNNNVFKMRDGFPVWINAISLPRIVSGQRKKKKRKRKKKKRHERLIDDMIQTDDQINWEDSLNEKPAPFDLSQNMLINSYRSPPANLSGILKTTEDEKDIFSQLLSVQGPSNSVEPSSPPSDVGISNLSTSPIVAFKRLDEGTENKDRGSVSKIITSKIKQDLVITTEERYSGTPPEPYNFSPTTKDDKAVTIFEDSLLQVARESPQSKVTLKADQTSSDIMAEALLRKEEVVQNVNAKIELDSQASHEEDCSVILTVDAAEDFPAGDAILAISEDNSKSPVKASYTPNNVLPTSDAENSYNIGVVNDTGPSLEQLLVERSDSEGKEGLVYCEPSVEIITNLGNNDDKDMMFSGEKMVLQTTELSKHPNAQHTTELQQPRQEAEIFTELYQPQKGEEDDTSESHINANFSIEDMLQKSPSPSLILLKATPKKKLAATFQPSPTDNNWNRSSSPVHEGKQSDLENDDQQFIDDSSLKYGQFNSEELYDDVDKSLSSDNIPQELPELPDWDSPVKSSVNRPESADLRNVSEVLEKGVFGEDSHLSATASPEFKKSLTLPAGQPGFSEEYFKKPSLVSQNSDPFPSSIKDSQRESTKPSVIIQSMLGQSHGQRYNIFKIAPRQPFKKGVMIELKTEKLPRRNNAALLQKQDGLCASCGARLIKNMFGRPLYHYCRYLGSLHCQNCIKNDKAIVPARVIHEIDCNMKKVSVKAKVYLDRMLNMPCISILMFTDEVVQRSRELKSLKMLVEQLRHIRQFIEVCRHKDAHYQNLNDQKINYLMQSSMLTLQEVVDCIKGDFLKHLSSCTNKLKKHIKRECTICKLRGHFCEICKDATVIYSFDIENVIQCNGCKNIFHLGCWVKNDLESGVSCPKCLREADRKCRRLVLESAFRSNSFDSS